MKEKWTHDGLLGDLAAHLRGTRDRVVWEDMQLGPAGSKRPDIYTIPKSFTQFRPLAYEIKVTASDYRRDVTAGKWQHYLKFASGVTFATPAGLITKDDLPKGCGLIVRGPDGWRTVKAPTLAVVNNLPRDAWIKLIIDGIERQARAPSNRPVPAEWKAEKIARKHFGEDLARMIAMAATAPERLKHAAEIERERHDHMITRERARYERERAELKRCAEQIDAARALLCEALDIDPSSDPYTLASALREAARKVSRDAEVGRLREIALKIRRLVADEG